jgi:hypothetical protein
MKRRSFIKGVGLFVASLAIPFKAFGKNPVEAVEDDSKYFKMQIDGRPGDIMMLYYLVQEQRSTAVPGGGGMINLKLERVAYEYPKPLRLPAGLEYMRADRIQTPQQTTFPRFKRIV